MSRCLKWQQSLIRSNVWHIISLEYLAGIWVDLPEITESELALCNASDMHLGDAWFDSWLKTSNLTVFSVLSGKC
jgi:hypothetical protein